ncbi:MAG TPA: hypothetical protein VM680_03710 [Verrucomicrobiae bacterium]|nr:hypothetical protein [Verrucomicrobiae bacterium]
MIVLMKMVWSVAAILWLCGCSSFNKEWKAALKAPIPQNSIEGPWTGEWRSEKNGHHGALRCVVSKASEKTYRAHYHAVYWKILRFSYAATLNAEQTNGAVHLRGEANLGKLAGGVYKYDGSATSAEFRSTYSSKYDHGTFDMSRP